MENLTFPTKQHANQYIFDNNLPNTFYPWWGGDTIKWTIRELMPRQFHKGDKVKTVKANDWGSDQVLTVVYVKTISPAVSSCPHHRIRAVAPNGNSYEGAEYNFIGVPDDMPAQL